MKIVCFLPNYIGDVLMTTPSLRILKKYLNNSKIYVFLKNNLLELIQNNPYIDEIIVKKNKPYILKKIINLKPEYIILLRTTFFNSFASFVSHPNFSVGIKEQFSNLFLKKFFNQDLSRPYRYECCMLVDALLKYLNYNVKIESEELKKLDFFGWKDLNIENSLREKLIKVGVDMKKNFIILAPFASRKTKMLNINQYIKIIEFLYKKYNKKFEIILVGYSNDKFFIDELMNTCKNFVKFLFNNTTLKEIAFLFILSYLVFSTDSGLAYISESVGTKTIIFFTSTLPEKYGPYPSHIKVFYEPVICSPCYNDECRIFNYKCINNIDITKILELFEKEINL